MKDLLDCALGFGLLMGAALIVTIVVNILMALLKGK